MKLKKIATVAYSANVYNYIQNDWYEHEVWYGQIFEYFLAITLTAGISVTDPMAKQAPSDIEVSNIDGPTWPNALAMLSLTLVYCRLSKRLNVCTRMNRLSTPTASTKNGITSMVNIVVAKPT